MATVLVLYATTEGHTRKIAEEISNQIRELGHTPAVLDSTAAEAGRIRSAAHDAAFVLGSVHQGKHQASLVHWVKEHREELRRMPSAFVSVSLAAAGADPDDQAEAQRYIDEFLRETDWAPDETTRVAGALLYSKYDFLKRLVMKLIARSKGGDTDTSNDYEYTDWKQLRAFVSRFLARVEVPAPFAALGGA